MHLECNVQNTAVRILVSETRGHVTMCVTVLLCRCVAPCVFSTSCTTVSHTQIWLIVNMSVCAKFCQ